jgi:hypothetical protein
MAKDYNTPTDQLNAISWQLKRIADSLEFIADSLNSRQETSTPKDPTTSTLRNFLSNLGSDHS